MSVHFDVPPEVAFDYLVDPHRRSEWQSSLARVEAVSGDIAVGQTWTDVTVPGLRPTMETTELDRPHRWSERGTWRGFDAVLTLTFEAAVTGCDVHVAMHVAGRGVARPLASVLGLVSPRAVSADLRRASRTLSRRRTGE